jgi:cytidylate kinase
MPVVTMTGHLGSMGEVAHLVGQRLDYDVVDRELLIEAGEALGWSEEQVTAFDERTEGQGGRLVRLLRGFLERAGQSDLGTLAGGGMESVLTRTYSETAAAEMRPDDERYIAALREIIEQLAERGDIVLVGRGGQAVLAGRPDTLHVRVACPVEERARRVSERDGQPLDEARVRVRHSDEQREAWHQKYFEIDYRAPYHYHLVVNTGLLSDEDAADLVVRAHELRFGG